MRREHGGEGVGRVAPAGLSLAGADGWSGADQSPEEVSRWLLCPILPYAQNEMPLRTAGVPLHHARRSLRIVTLNGVHDLVMLFDQRAPPRSAQGIPPGECPDHLAVALSDRQRFAVEVAVVHDAMELLVEAVECDRVLDLSLDQVLDAPRASDLGLRGLLYEQPHEIWVLTTTIKRAARAPKPERPNMRPRPGPHPR
jgi:hypothetical protein